MVSHITRYAVALVLSCVFGLLVYCWYHTPASYPRGGDYSATGYDTDLAITDAIKREARRTQTVSEMASAVIVPHHLVAGEAVARGIHALVPQNPKVVFILSPDHFNRCASLLCTTYGSYQTFFGVVPIYSPTITHLLHAYDRIATSSLFSEEHGISAVVPFIAYYLPHTPIVPLVVSVHGGAHALERTRISDLLVGLLEKTEGVLVVSSDFSHYVSLSLAQEYDTKTEKVLCEGTREEHASLQNPAQSDCPTCLAILHEVAERTKLSPRVVWHSNSATLLHDETVQETTSHFTVLYSDNKPEACALRIE